ncbi:hypothetical protein ACP70R_003948 [Stipagrostis hirtigluma subsp. patula]
MAARLRGVEEREKQGGERRRLLPAATTAAVAKKTAGEWRRELAFLVDAVADVVADLAASLWSDSARPARATPPRRAPVRRRHTSATRPGPPRPERAYL